MIYIFAPIGHLLCARPIAGSFHVSSFILPTGQGSRLWETKAQRKDKTKGPELPPLLVGPAVRPQVQVLSLASDSTPPARPLGHEELRQSLWELGHSIRGWKVPTCFDKGSPDFLWMCVLKWRWCKTQIEQEIAI